MANSVQSNRYIKLTTFKTELLVSSTPPHYVWQLTQSSFHAQNLGVSLNFFLSLRPPPIHLYIESLLDFLAVFQKRILNSFTSLHPHPSHFTFLQWLPLKLRRKFQISCPSPKALPTSQFSSSDTLSLSHSSVQPSCFPQTTHFIPISGPLPFSLLLLGMTYYVASFYYSGLGSNVTSSDKWSLIIQPTSSTALLITLPLLFSVTHPILQLSPITFVSLYIICLPYTRKWAAVQHFWFILLTFIPNSPMPRTGPDT